MENETQKQKGCYSVRLYPDKVQRLQFIQEALKETTSLRLLEIVLILLML